MESCGHVVAVVVRSHRNLGKIGSRADTDVALREGNFDAGFAQGIKELEIEVASNLLFRKPSNIRPYEELEIEGALSQGGKPDLGPIVMRNAIFEHIHPPRIVLAQCHVIGHNIEKDAHVMGRESPNEGVERPGRAELRIELHGVCDRIAVPAPPAGLEQRRSIQVRDAEVMELGHEGSTGLELEVSIELHAVCGRWNPEVYHSGYTPLFNENGQLIAQLHE